MPRRLLSRASATHAALLPALLPALLLLGACSRDPAAPTEVPLRGTMQSTETVTPDMAAGVLRVVLTGTGDSPALGAFRIATTSAVNPSTGAGTGTTTLTAADGSTITGSLQGQGVRQPGQPTQVTEITTITGGTGRYANASGQYTLTRQTDESTGRSTGTLAGTVRLGR